MILPGKVEVFNVMQQRFTDTRKRNHGDNIDAYRDKIKEEEISDILNG